MMKSIASISLLFIFTISNTALSYVAKVIIIKGEIRAKDPDTKKVYKVKKNDRIKEGTLIQTAQRSFVKMIFKDQSQVSLGPKSQMKVTKFPKKKSGILTLIKGQMRTKVQKDLINDRKDKNKLYIRTKTAAMGVRGTEFDTIYNAQSKRTAVITYEGEVQIAQVDKAAFTNKTSYQSIREIVNSQNAVATQRGTIVNTTTSEGGRFITKPVKMNQAQFHLIEKNGFNSNNTSSSSQKKKSFNNPIPPGVNTKSFVNNNRDKTIVETLASLTGKNTAEKIEQLADSSNKNQLAGAALPPPEGKVYNNGSIAPAAGGSVHLPTGAYFPPPAGSTFDPVTKTYQAPADYGSIDKLTGAFIPPKGTRVDSSGTLTTDSSRGLGKNIASTQNKTTKIKTVSLSESAKSADSMTVAKVSFNNSENFDYRQAKIDTDFSSENSVISKEEFVEQFKQQALQDVFTITPDSSSATRVRLNVNVNLENP